MGLVNKARNVTSYIFNLQSILHKTLENEGTVEVEVQPLTAVKRSYSQEECEKRNPIRKTRAVQQILRD